ncbi:SMC-Scp complex subunit ScpB [Bifidobacterium sp. 82T24]|uniref:SMC-Scp complex subunit ScpB n=1 Tax=Bifidobacterium pluvialisilvae TaxID=2834436 RepID=UPI001C56F3EF|nr:SMC-Scp complex subunit ScpB [Bifidobacterium pluvialisilvae]MBW3087320.1 SMC-Scp complex subunit ScpB [Bifidobacterium pluvialisilvae]
MTEPKTGETPATPTTGHGAGHLPGGLRPCLEALLIVTDRPLRESDLARVLDVDAEQVKDALRGLRDDYAGDGSGPARGFELRHTVRGWQLASRREFEPVVRALVTDGQTSRLSQAASETLAIIAYRQPVTRAQVTAIRGVNSDGVIRSLTLRGLVVEQGLDEETHAALLATSDLFLELMGIDGLDELPSLAPFLPESVAEAEA